MKEQIKELRVKIDGLSQLVKSMDGGPKYQLDMSTKPKGLDIKEWVKIFEENNYLFVDTNQGESKGLIQSSELHKCYNSLILAKAWLGKVLGELGEPTPYTNDGDRKTVEDIEPAADSLKLPPHEDFLYGKWGTMNHIEKVDWLRQEIKILILDVNDKLDLINLPNNSYIKSGRYTQFVDKVYEYLCEARFWLGFELERIRESSGGNI